MSNGYGSVESVQGVGDSERATLLTNQRPKAWTENVGTSRAATITTCALVIAISLFGLESKRLWTRHEPVESLWDELQEDAKARTRRSSSEPLSLLDPVNDLNLPLFTRPASSRPAIPLTANGNQTSYPTNSWYQSLLMPEDEPTSLHRTYSIPYLIDASGIIPGVQAHPNHISASSTVVSAPFEGLSLFLFSLLLPL